MSPVLRLGRTIVLLGVAMLIALPVAAAQDEPIIPADAPEPAAGKITRILTFGVIEEGCPGGAPAPCWDVATVVASPGDTVVLRADLRNSPGIHNVHVTEGAETSPKTQLASEELHTVAFTMPASGEATFICDAHPETMVAKVVTPAAALESGGHGASVPSLGVNFLAYWVGVIAFAVLFVVYGITFFLFKYNETNATTDHFDRAEAGVDRKLLRDRAALLGLTIAAVVVAVVLITKYLGNIEVLKAEVATLNTQVATLTTELAAAKAG